MRLLNSNRNKIIFLLIITLLIFIGWQIGYEAFHARILAWFTNGLLKITGSHKIIKYEISDRVPIFMVYELIRGKGTRFPQEIGPILQPTVILLAWQLFLFFVLSLKQAFRLVLINFGIFLALQVFFLVQLTGYHASSVHKFLYSLMVDSFYIIALILVIKDTLFYPVFRKK